jgi:hypothetical protein
MGVARKACDRLVTERELTPRAFAELTAKLNEAAYARMALVEYIDGRLTGDPVMLLEGNTGRKPYVPEPMAKLYCRVAGGLATRLARAEAAEGNPPSLNAFRAALQRAYAALSKDVAAQTDTSRELQGPTWADFNKQAQNSLNAVVVVPKRAQAPTLDGVLTPGEWDEAPVLTGFYEYVRKKGSTDEKAEFQTEVRLGYDDRFLYLAYRAIEEDVANVTAMYDKRDAAVWNDDSADFSILPPGVESDAFYHFVINPKGAFFDHTGRDNAWDSKVTVKTGTDKQANAWVLEIAIPWDDFGKKASAGEVWRAQFARSDWRGGRNHPSSWAQTKSGFNNSDYMGLLLFK